MARDHQRGKPTLGKIGCFRITQGEHEEMKSAALAAGMSFSAYARQRLGLDAPESPALGQRRGPSNCTCGITIANANGLCPERDCPHR